MEEEGESRRSEEEARAVALASLRPELSVCVTSNGHDLDVTAAEGRHTLDPPNRKVDPLKIRIGPKTPRGSFGDTKSRGITPIVSAKDRQTESKVSSAIPKQRISDKRAFGGKMVSQAPSMALGRFHPESQKQCFPPLRKGKTEKGTQLKKYAQSLGLQPTVKFKCRKCSSTSFKSLPVLKEHQRQCKASGGGGEAERAAAGADGAPGRVTRKVYLCSACSTYYENWNLFLHMREVHNRHICLFCLGMFSKAEKLASHLVGKHGIVERSFKDKAEFHVEYDGSFYLMCCFCDKLYTEQDNFSMHKCTESSPVPISHKVSKEMTVNATCENICPGPDINETKTDVTKPDANRVELLDTTVTPLTTEESATEHKTSSDTSIDDPADRSHNTDICSNLTPEAINNNKFDIMEKPFENIDNFLRLLPTPATCATQEEVNTKNNDKVISAPIARSSSSARDRESTSSDDTEDTSGMDVDPPKSENNNITSDKERNGGIKLKLCLNNALSPVIINSTVQPESIPKPQVRPNRPPGAPVFVPREQAQVATVNNVHSTIYDNKLDNVNPMNRVPKLTVRVPKGLLDKDSSSDKSSDSDVSEKLTVDDTLPEEEVTPIPAETELSPQPAPPRPDSPQPDESADPAPPGKEVVPVEEEVAATELTLDRPLDKYPLKELLKVFVGATMYYCVYCNHVRKIAVNCKQLALHMLDEHRFSATVDSITAEELLPETIKQRVHASLHEVESIFVNLDTYDSVNPCELLPYVRTYECFQCYFITTVHKDLYLHNRKMHQKTILLCVMCKSNFYSYSELLCHLCPGTYDSECEMRFRCCMCNMDNIPSAFRLMVHLRKVHHACDVCTEVCNSQSRLSMHVWKHKLHHLCYRCGIAYRNKADITKHLFWKHGTESVLCKRCLQKKWPHVYHFCIPPSNFVCEECNLNFTRAVSLKVHKRLHSGNYPHPCLENDCVEKFVSKKLLMKHMLIHQEPICEEPVVKSESTNIVVDHKEELKEDNPEESKKDIKIEENAEAVKPEPESPVKSIKVKKKKNKDKDSFLLDVNLPALNLSESDSTDDSDPGPSPPKVEEEIVKPKAEDENDDDKIQLSDLIPVAEVEEKPSEKQALDIWDNFKQYQAKVEKQKTPPLVLIRKHVCESDHDYCLIPNDVNGEGGNAPSKRQKKRSPRKRSNKNSTGSSSSSSSSSSSDSCCSRGSKCSCSSSSGSSSSSSSDSDSSDSLRERKKKISKNPKRLQRRRDSDGSHASAVDIMAMEETPALIPEKREPPIAESDLETEETETDEEFYDEHPQRLANKLYAEKRNQLMLLASVAPSDNSSIAGDISRPVSPEKERSPKKKNKTKKRKKSKREIMQKHEPIKLNIPKEAIGRSVPATSTGPALIPNKITISLHSNTVQIPNMPKSTADTSALVQNLASTSQENKRASKRRRVPNKFYGYSSDEDTVTKPQQPPKLEWRTEDLPSPVITHKPQPTISHRVQNYNDPIIRMSTPVPDPVPPPILMNTESLNSSETDSSDEYTLKIVQPNAPQNSIPVPPVYVSSSGPTSLPVNFPKPAGVRQAREGESVYCYCRCPYDEVSEMIACDAIGCAIEWFHFECVGIMVPPKGKWYCPDCRQRGFI